VTPLGRFWWGSIALWWISWVGWRDRIGGIRRLRREWRLIGVWCVLTRSASFSPTAINDGVYDSVQSASVYDRLGHVARFDHCKHSTTQHCAEYVLGTVEARAGVPDVDEDVILPNAWLHVYLKRSGPLRRFQLVCPFLLVSGMEKVSLRHSPRSDAW
jgi:hypothetical protein